jgi:Histidine kinase-, DNA gyrase B-, and HSP90-like ATPase
MREIALHLLDIAENSVAAQAQNITISVFEDLVCDRLSAAVQDDGKGMDAEMLSRVTDPFVTSRTTRKVGLGIPLLKAAAEACNGYLCMESQLGMGTRLEVSFQRSHIDRMPLGDLPGTILTLVVAYPQINWIFQYRVCASAGNSDAPEEREYLFESQPVKEILGDVPFSEPEVLSFIRISIQEGVAGIQSALPEFA